MMSNRGCAGVKASFEGADSIDPVTNEASLNPFSGWSKPTKPASLMQACTPFLFSRVIRLRYPLPSATTDAHLHAYKAALHYNLALSLQMLLLKRQSGVPPLISSPARVSKHYEAVYQEWKRAKTLSFEKEDGHTTVLGLALFNNMGVLFYCEFARF